MQIAFLFYDGMTALDAIGPYEVLARLSGVSVKTVALKNGPIKTGLGLELLADYALSDVSSADILLVPGSGNATSLRDQPEILEWIRVIHNCSLWTTSVCTGSLILGAAGLLQGVQATTHWAVMERLSGWGAIPVSARMVTDGKIITAAGVSAGIDMALMLAAKLAGQEVAESLQLGLEYDPEPPYNAGSPAKAAPHIVNSLRARLRERFEPEL